MKKESTSRHIIQKIFARDDNKNKEPNDCGNVFDIQVQIKADNEQCETSERHNREHFVEICEYNCGSMFNLGEHMEDRAIVAKHMEVQCLLIPHYWLFQKKQNSGNIWQR